MNCFYCDAKIFEKTAPGIINKLIPPPVKVKNLVATKDHKVPRCMTRGQHNHGIVLCCEQCNSEKSNLTLEEYRVLKAFRYGYISGVQYEFPGEKLEAQCQTS